MNSQNLKNSYQVNVMSESESVNFHEKSEENLPENDGNTPELHEGIKDDPSAEENREEEGEEEGEETRMTEESSSERKDFSHKKEDQRDGFTAQFEAFKKDFEDQT